MTSVDILTPLRHKRFVRGDVIQRILAQGIEFSWFVDAGEDVEISDHDIHLLDCATASKFWRNHMAYMVKILAKRNRLMSRGTSEFIYLADADVTLPERPLLPEFLEAFARNKTLGAVGVTYAVDWPFLKDHVGAGSMMLRRADLEVIGELRGMPCECSYIRNRLMTLGKEVIALDGIHAHQWKRTLLDGDRAEHDAKEEACPLCGEVRNPVADSDYEDIHFTTDAEGLLPTPMLQGLLDKHGTAFRLFVEHP